MLWKQKACLENLSHFSCCFIKSSKNKFLKETPPNLIDTDAPVWDEKMQKIVLMLIDNDMEQLSQVEEYAKEALQ